MKLHDLHSPKGATKPRKRVGRGISAGKGKTAGRGEKGQNKRSGGGKGPYFEGGQLPLVRRLPTLRGFTNRFRVEYQPVNVSLLAELFEAGAEITPDALAAARIIRPNGGPVVILGDGEINTAVHVKAQRFSASAREKIEAAGGTVEVVD
ncbi:MAG TPA: 50S ribosomal protein L15 [Caldilineae bacterium]|nr:50S ribosomal protein L15 [Caldilineae bacterium]